jgi:Uma2 family endonuclease
MSAVLAPTETPAPITVEQFVELVEDGQKADLIDGEIFMASPDSPKSDLIGFFLRTLIQRVAKGRRPGQAFGSRVAFELSRYRCPEPDVSFVLAERLDIIAPGRGVGAPDIAVEIVSDDSIQRDYVRKRVLYEESGVREYWIVDPIANRCLFLVLEGGRFAEAPLLHGRYFQSGVLPGFWLDPRWVLAWPLPDEDECLQKILAGPPPAP